MSYMGENSNKFSLCPNAFETEKEQRHHELIHLEEKRYECPACYKSFSRKWHLKEHLYVHMTDEKPYECDKCGMSFRQRNSLYQHQKRRHRKRTKSYECFDCKKVFALAEYLRRHRTNCNRKKNPKITRSGGKSFQCQFCGDVFALKRQLSQHLEEWHPDEDETHDEEHSQNLFWRDIKLKEFSVVIYGKTPYVCSRCFQEFSRKKYLIEHTDKCISEAKLEIKTETFELESITSDVDDQIENKSFMEVEVIKSYVKEEEGIKSNVDEDGITNYCQYGPKVLQNIVDSTIDNAAEKVKEVVYCATTPSDINKMHVCDVCGKRFKQRYQLGKHQMIHTGEKPYSCDVCAMKFTRKSNLKNHARVHSDLNDYICRWCGVKFSRKNYLTMHEKAVHRVEMSVLEIHRCKFCAMKFTTSKELQGHQKMHNDGSKKVKEFNDDMTNYSAISEHSPSPDFNSLSQTNHCLAEPDILSRAVLASFGASIDHDEEFSPSTLEASCALQNSQDESGRITHTSQMKQLESEILASASTSVTDMEMETPAPLYNQSVFVNQSDSQSPAGDVTGTSHIINRTNHAATKSNEKIYVCDVCDKFFNHCGNFLRHKKTHLKHNHLLDSEADNSSVNIELVNSDNIESDNRHPPLGCEYDDQITQLKYKCDQCEKRFIHGYQLARHKSVHSTERPFECGICHKFFTLKHSLTRHMNIHSGEKAYKCQVCSKIFGLKGNLKRHKKLRHNILIVDISETMEAPVTDEASINLIPTGNSVTKAINITEDVISTDESTKTCAAKNERSGNDRYIDSEFTPKPDNSIIIFGGSGTEELRSSPSKIRDKVCIGYAIEPFIAYPADDPMLSLASSILGTDATCLNSPEPVSSGSESTMHVPGYIELQPATFSDENRVLYQCSICYQTYTSSDMLMQHASVHWDSQSV